MENFEDLHFDSVETPDLYYQNITTYNDVCRVLNIDKETLLYLINRTGKRSESADIKRAYNHCFNNITETMTDLGFYLLVCFSTELKKYSNLEAYIEPAKDSAFITLIKYFGYKATGLKKRKKSNIPAEFKANSFEEIMELNLKKIPTDLKQVNTAVTDQSHLFYNKKIVITGNFENFPVRKIMAEWIYEVGGDNNSSISKKTNFVIMGENAGPKKLELIAQYGIQTITEQEFIELFPFKEI